MDEIKHLNQQPKSPVATEQLLIDQLRGHLHGLQKAYSLIIKPSAKNPKRIHNFRVTARKALALLNLCPSFFLVEDLRRTRKQLKWFRKITNNLRDLDIISTWLASQRYKRETELIQEFAKKERKRAHRKLKKKVIESNEGTRLHFRLETRLLFSAPSPWQDPDSTLPLEIRKGLAILEEDFLAAFPTKMKPEALHRLRIRCKNFRYCVEALEPHAALKSAPIKVLEDLQKRLGLINDLETTKTWLKAVFRKKRNKGIGMMALDSLGKIKKEIRQSIKGIATWFTQDTARHLREAVDGLIGPRDQVDRKTDPEPLPPE